MAYISTKLVQLERAKKIAEQKEAYIKQARDAAIGNNTVTPYQSEGTQITYWVQSHINPELFIEVKVPESHFADTIGASTAGNIADKLGGVGTEPLQAAIVNQKNYANKYMSIRFIHLDPTPVAKLTPWGSRVVKRYRKVGGAAFKQFPVGGNYKAANAKFLALKAAPGPFKTGVIQLLGAGNNVLSSHTVA